MPVSVIIPAYNAADTLTAALASLTAQTHAEWEAIVVDDGSTDGTGSLARELARQDRRIRVISGTHAGESAARNRGLSEASHEWILYLDADDWVLPTHLERCLGLARSGDVDVACCRWSRVLPDGRNLGESYSPDLDRPFDILARFNPFAIHSCIVRRAVVYAVEGFDPSLQTCEDWDLWQRVARAGARFRGTSEVLAAYRVRPTSASHRALQVLDDGLTVIARGHGPDPRVQAPVPALAQGRDRALMNATAFQFACWPAGMILGQGGDASPVLERFANLADHDLDPGPAASSLWRAALIGAGRLPDDGAELWPTVQRGLESFLTHLERRSGAEGIAHRIRAAVEKRALEGITTRPASLGRTHVTRIEATDPIPDFHLDPSLERIECEVEIGGLSLGNLDLPICDGFVPGLVVADAIAAKFAWPILGRFFQANLYPQPPAEANDLDRWCAMRGIAIPAAEKPSDLHSLHAEYGWIVFLQELFDRPGRTLGQLTDPTIPAPPAARRIAGPINTVELSRDLPRFVGDGGPLQLLLTLGGVGLGAITLPMTSTELPVHELLSAVLDAGGFELCRAAVREGILGRSLTNEPTALRHRLQEVAVVRQARSRNRAVTDTLPPPPGLLLPRRVPGEIRSSTSRRAHLPSGAAAEVTELARVTGEPIVPIMRADESWEPPGWIEYAPDIVTRTASPSSVRPERAHFPGETHQLAIVRYLGVRPATALPPAPGGITPERFERQLRWLRDAGYRSVDPEEWTAAIARLESIPGRAVMLTFDAADQDFVEYAWPLLRQFGFGAVLFVATDLVGQPRSAVPTESDLPRWLDWTELDRLVREGVRIGSQSSRPVRLSSLGPTELVKDLVRSRSTLQRQLGTSVRTIAYPAGDADEIVRHLAAACGFVHGFSNRPGLSTIGDDALWLPRIECADEGALEDCLGSTLGGIASDGTHSPGPAAAPGGAQPRVSVIIPAANASATIAETLHSVMSQTFAAWEAIVVDDASTDDTAAIVERLAERDDRLQLIRRPKGGASAARNAGLGRARGELILFLDADDLIRPSHLESLRTVLDARPEVGAAYSGWARLTPDGTVSEGRRWNTDGDFFPIFGRICAFAVHACLVRRRLIEEAGGYDPSLSACADWDLWQRIARTGVTFAPVAEVGAIYRMRPSSMSADPTVMLDEGLRVLDRGHQSDPRVKNPASAHAQGLAVDDLPARRYGFVCWSAGLLLGLGRDARPALEPLRDDRAPDLDPSVVVGTLWESFRQPLCLSPRRGVELWPEIVPRLRTFLDALEAQSLARGLARPVELALERIVLGAAPSRPLTLGRLHAVSLAADAPIPELDLPGGAERLVCDVTVGGRALGSIELPVVDGTVSRAVVTDAIAARFGWRILGRFFHQTIYRELAAIPADPDGTTRWRARGIEVPGAFPVTDSGVDALHDEKGWTIFLQEIWGRMGWPMARFYDRTWTDQGDEPTAAASAEDRTEVEVSDVLPTLRRSVDPASIAVTVGGVRLGPIPLPADREIVTPQSLRALITGATGIELCIAAVREALIGRPLDAPGSLRERLRACAKTPSERALPAAPGTLTFGRRFPELYSSGPCRVADLPVAAAEVLQRLARRHGEPIDSANGPGTNPARARYLPRVLPSNALVRSEAGATHLANARNRLYGRDHFEHVFAERQDPWEYTTPYEQVKYDQTLSLLPETRPIRALEIGCAEGHFTAQLAHRVDELIAADISRVALDRTRQRCRSIGNVSYLRLDVATDALPGGFDLIVCSEMLYYVGDRAALEAVVHKIAAAIRPGGFLVTAHARVLGDEPASPGFDWNLAFGVETIANAFRAVDGLRLDTEIQTDAYRVSRFQRLAGAEVGSSRSHPPRVLVAPYGRMTASVSAAFVGRAGVTPGPKPPPREPEVFTDRLPILMYHRVAVTGARVSRCYRVTPADLDEQLGFLHDAGYQSVTIGEWEQAMARRQALPGRRVLLTFDDGYVDFAELAWPILRKYGFGAYLYVVTGRIGLTNQWDAAFGETIQLLDWPAIRSLAADGVSIGSHTVTHPPLTSLPPDVIVRELCESRDALEQGLGQEVTSIAYPHGDLDRVVQHLTGACGYRTGLSCRPGRSNLADPSLALPRIEITGFDSFKDFLGKLDTVS